MLRSHGRVRPVLVAMLMAMPFAGVGATLTARAAGADPTVPSAPRNPFAVVSGATGARVSWKAPANDGGSPITGYTVIPYLGANLGGMQTPQVFNSPATAATLVGLKMRATYRFDIVATNSVGSSHASSFTGAIVIGAPSAPPKPTVQKVATATLKVFFHPPKQTNGAPIKRYSVSCRALNNPRKITKAGGPASPIIVSDGPPNLIAGHRYTCVVVAYNGRGPSVPSAPSNQVKA